jgi:hypothetical protein
MDDPTGTQTAGAVDANQSVVTPGVVSSLIGSKFDQLIGITASLAGPTGA